MRKYGLINKILKPFGLLMIKAMAAGGGGWSPLMLTSGYGNTSGEKVNNSTALTISALFACIRNVSEDIAKVPLKVYRKEGQYRYEQTDHPLFAMLQYQPNPEMTAISLRETLNAQAMGWGNAYAEIQRDVFGKPIYLWPIRPDRVKMMRERETERIFYRITTEKGSQSDIWGEDIMHLHGLGFDGMTGYNIVQYAAQSIGATIGMDKFAGAYFANGMHQSGTVKHPGSLTKPAQDRLREQLSDEFGGASKAHKFLILEEGMEFMNNIIDPKASQMIETRQFSVTEFCRWLRVPPHKVADLTRSTYSNIEEQNIDYVQDGLLGWYSRWEQVLWWKLLSDKEKKDGYYFKHSVDGLLRGDLKGRVLAYTKMWEHGVYNIDEIREKEELNPVEGGDKRFVPMNYVTLEDVGQNAKTNAVIKDMAKRLASSEIDELEKHIKYAEKDIGKFKDWLSEFYSKHDRYIAKAISPLFDEINIRIEMLSLKPFMQMTNAPALVLSDRKNKHTAYIAANLRGYYENR